MQAVNHNLDEKFNFTSSLKKKVFIVGIAGLLLMIAGIFTTSSGDHHGEESHEAVAEVVVQDQDQHGEDHALDAEDSPGEASHGAESHGEFSWADRLKADLWINNMYFTGLAIIGVFFFAIQYVSQSGWSAGILRIPMSFGTWLPIAFVLMLVGYFWGGHEIFHWTHGYLYDKSSPLFDSIINGKAAFFFWPTEPSGDYPFPIFGL
ncbi:hypothetical protein [Mangrovivirga cuniculi]|uniref:hypothetical protein n=1 Tax=Mangrovivirga cuniculi TaxID=2715131 RepID=UPI0026BBB64F|nr:hypothetical protein [Mangrovivirga cuniculi]